jgi:hypothetical protein
MPLVAWAVLAAVGPGYAQGPATLRYGFPGPVPGGYQGVAVSAAGDVDGDGWMDFVVGASGHASPAAFMGIARIHSGRTELVIGSLTGLAGLDETGYAVSAAGDLNHDGYADILVGSIGADVNGPDSGSCHVLSGEWIAKTALGQTPLTPRFLFVFHGDGPGDNFGLVVARAGDVDQDGTEDILVGAPRDDDQGSNCGSIRIFSGATGQILATFFGDAAGDQLGHAGAGVGDVNGDGWPDVAGGAFGADIPAANAGMVRIYSGEWIARTAAGQVPVTAPILGTVRGTTPQQRFGTWISPAGDFNLDGVPDLVVGAPGSGFAGTGSGSVFVVSGEWIASTALMVPPLTPQVLRRHDGLATGDNLGTSGGAADLDGDGHADVFGGAPFEDTAGLNSGSVTVWSGATGAVLGRWLGPGPGASYGMQVKSVPDIDVDGLSELIIGAPFAMPNGLDSGLAEVRSLAFARPYGLGAGGMNTLELTWVPGPPPALHQGFVHFHAGTPGSLALFLLSTHRTEAAILPGLTAFVDLGPAFLGHFEVPIPAAGEIYIAISLKEPALAGLSLHVQTAELAPVLRASNGLTLVFAP